MNWRPRPIILAAFSTALAASAALPLEVEVASERLDPGDRQTVTVSGLDRGEGVELAWIDPTGRVRRAWTLRANRRGEAAARFRTRDALSGTHRAVAWLKPSGDARLSSAAYLVREERSFTVLPGRPPEYLAVLDAGGDEAAGARLLVRVFEGGPPFLDLDPAPGAARPFGRLRTLRTAYRKNPSDELLARPVCLHDRSWAEQIRRWAAPRAERLARGRPWLWSLGRGVELAPGDGGLDFCRSPHCMRAFAGHMGYLHRRYGDVDRLNRAWRTSFANFGEARPPTGAEVLAVLAGIDNGEGGGEGGGEAGGEAGGDLDARLPGMLASWSDHRRFLDATWAQTLSKCREHIRSIDRRAKVGLEGVRLPGVFTGYDPTRFLGALDWSATEPRPLELALVRSFTPRNSGGGGFRTLTELGGAHPALDLWRGFVGGHRGAMLRQDKIGDLSERERRDLAGVLRALEGGLATLVGRSTWEPDPVAVLYSQDSVRVEWLMGCAGLPEGGKRPPAGAALVAWAQLLSDLGISAEFVDSKDIARKALRNSRARVLILPRAYVLGRLEFREISRFVRAGGLVIADAGAGLYDETFTDSHSFGVSDLFAIERPDRIHLIGAQTGRRTGALATAGKLRLADVNVPGAFIDGVGPEGLRVAEVGLRTLPGFAFANTAADLGGDETAAIVSSPEGRGRAVYLNLALEDYPEIRTRRGGANLRRLVMNALELARVRPRVEVVARGEDVWGCERNSWRLEETEVFTMWLDPAAMPEGASSPLDAELVFEFPAYCYDVLHGVLLGYGERIPVRLGGGANVFARMPYDVESISIRAKERGDAVATEITYEAVVETTTGLAGTHIVSQDLLDPRGRRVPGGSRIIVAERGVAKGRVRMALNEPSGEYSLVFRDATTGVEGTIIITRGETELGKRFPIEVPDR